MKPEPLIAVIFAMRLSAAAGAYIMTLVLPPPLDKVAMFAAHVMGIMSAMVAFAHVEKVIGETIVTHARRIIEIGKGIGLLIAGLVVIGLKPGKANAENP